MLQKDDSDCRIKKVVYCQVPLPIEILKAETINHSDRRIFFVSKNTAFQLYNTTGLELCLEF